MGKIQNILAILISIKKMENYCTICWMKTLSFLLQISAITGYGNNLNAYCVSSFIIEVRLKFIFAQ